jgi:cell division protein FtsB
MAKRPLSLQLSVLGLLGLLVLLQGRLWFTDEGWPEVVRLRSSVAEQQADIEKLQERNARLKAEVNDLKEGFAALEERARSDLGMVGPEESFYLFVPSDAATDASD